MEVRKWILKKTLNKKSMKRRLRNVMIAVMALIAVGSFGQTINEDRMVRDIEVAENILSTMLKQQYDKRSFFPLEVKGNYREGYGVTFTLPNMQTGIFFENFDMPARAWSDDGASFSGFIYNDESPEDVVVIDRGQKKAAEANAQDQRNKSVAIAGSARAPRAAKGGTFTKRSGKANRDSIKEESSQKVIKAGKEFLVDYGDLIGQLTPNEKIIVTNRGEDNNIWFGQFDNNANNYLSIEALKGDLTQYKQGKLTRDQLLAKIKVINSEKENELQPDLELLASIFNRLYRSDLSKTFFVQENTYYERLKDFGAIYYMQVYSSNQQDQDLWSLPTVYLEGVDQATRDKKVKELYPLFTKSIKEDMLEYGRTLRSLKDDENLILNIKMTRCRGCGIPSSIEYAVKNSVLKDYSTGKISKEVALQKITEKKGADQ
jgi:hypothetical protein